MKRNYTALLVDDERESGVLMGALLGKLNDFDISLRHATTPNEAFEAFKASDYDLYFFDYNLGNVNGIELFQEAKSRFPQSLDKHAPSILITANADPEVAAEAFRSGMTDAMSKGALSTNSLEALIMRAISKHDLEIRLSSHKRAISAKNAELEKFFQTVSHELKTPLTAVSESLSLLAESRKGQLSIDPDRLIDIARENCVLLKRFIDDLYDLSKTDTGRFQVIPKPCQLHDTIELGVRTVESAAKKKGICIQVENLPSDLTLNLDKERITQVLVNLLTNAIKYCPSGTVVKVAAKVTGSEGVTICVEDDGPGIPEQHQPHIFDRLYQVDDGGKHFREPGMGIGLSLCREIIRQHGSEIHLESQPGKGSKFWFILPNTRQLQPGKNNS